MITIEFLLHPRAWEILESGDCEPVDIAELRELQWNNAADEIEKLRADGWEDELSGPNVVFSHAEIRSRNDVLARLRKLGLKTDDFIIITPSMRGER